MADDFLSPEQQQALAARIQAGDRTAESEMVRALGGRVFALLVARTRDREASRDLFQETMLAAVSSVRSGQLRDPQKLAVYVQGVARNLANDYIRGQVRRSMEDALPSEDLAVYAPDLSEQSERDALARRAINQLESIDRDILMRTLVDGDKPGDIARTLGLSSDSVRQRKSRAMKKVAEYVRRLSRMTLGGD